MLIEGCSVSGITLNNTYKGQDADSYSDGDLFYAMEQSFSHAFIGNMVNVSKKPTLTTSTPWNSATTRWINRQTE